MRAEFRSMLEAAVALFDLSLLFVLRIEKAPTAICDLPLNYLWKQLAGQLRLHFQILTVYFSICYFFHLAASRRFWIGESSVSPCDVCIFCL
jgi:hypothetical protein